MPVTRCGFDVTRDDNEKEIFPKFLERIEAKGDIFGNTPVDDQMLIRFLRARAYDFDRAEEMFLAALAWREANDVISMLEYKPKKKEIRTYITGGMHKYDREGDPLVFDRLGQVDAKGVIKAFGEEEIVKHDIFRQERREKIFREESQRQGRLVHRITYVVDLNGLSLKHIYAPAIQAFKRVVVNGEANYPERLKRAMIVNAPSIFPRVWNLVKNFFDPRTQKKIFVLGTNYYEELVKHIPEENIPAFLGGKSTIDGDPYCKADLPPGGPIPHYLYEDVNEDDDEEGEKTVVVKAGSFHIQSVEALEKQRLKWKFKTESKDIGFELTLVKDDGNEVTVIGNERLKSDEEGIAGEYVVNEPGKYVFKWDNTFSWTRAKTLTYGIERTDSSDLLS